jgi:hypothetical protein
MLHVRIKDEYNKSHNESMLKTWLAVLDGSSYNLHMKSMKFE